MRSSRFKTACGRQDRCRPTVKDRVDSCTSPLSYLPLPHREQLCTSTAPTSNAMSPAQHLWTIASNQTLKCHTFHSLVRCVPFVSSFLTYWPFWQHKNVGGQYIFSRKLEISALGRPECSRWLAKSKLLILILFVYFHNNLHCLLIKSHTLSNDGMKFHFYCYYQVLAPVAYRGGFGGFNPPPPKF
jgi:hypothetical protein